MLNFSQINVSGCIWKILCNLFDSFYVVFSGFRLKKEFFNIFGRSDNLFSELMNSHEFINIFNR